MLSLTIVRFLFPMIFDIITIFPRMFKGFIKEGLLGKAVKKDLLEVNIHNLRDWTDDKHKTVDDKPFGGGLGMVMKIEPIFKAVTDLKKNDDSRVILFGPRGKRFSQSSAHRLSKANHLIMICGRYDGVDERVSQYIADEEISIGDYVLMGGEIPAMVVIECISRLIPGVIGKEEFLKERISSTTAIEYPQFTRPAIFKPSSSEEWKVPDILLSGDHKEIAEWKDSQGRII